MTLHRVSTTFLLAFGLLLYFVIIPNQVESVSYGWLRPNTIPNALAILLVIVTALQLFTAPSGEEDVPTLPQFFRAAVFFAGVGTCTYFMSQFGFLPVALLMSLALMLVVGERRLIWLGVGGIVIPVLIWFCAEVLLDRPLP